MLIFQENLKELRIAKEGLSAIESALTVLQRNFYSKLEKVIALFVTSFEIE